MVANILFLAIGYVTIPLFARIVTIKKSVLLPLIAIEVGMVLAAMLFIRRVSESTEIV